MSVGGPLSLLLDSRKEAGGLLVPEDQILVEEGTVLTPLPPEPGPTSGLPVMFCSGVLITEARCL